MDWSLLDIELAPATVKNLIRVVVLLAIGFYGLVAGPGWDLHPYWRA